MIEKIKASISLKIAALALIACGITKIITMTTDFYIADLCMIASVYICCMTLLFFVMSSVFDLLNEKSESCKSVIVMLYFTVGAYFLYRLICLTFISSFDIVISLFNLLWKLFICADGILIFYKIAIMIFGKSDKADNNQKQ